MAGKVRGRNEQERRHRPAAFTLVELMVTLTVGGIALGSIYSIGSASTHHFRDQQRIASTQTSVRMAMDQLKRDLQRAGFLGTPNAGLPREQCGNNLPPNALHAPAGSGSIAAISHFEHALINAGNGNTNVDPTGSNGIASVDTVVLMGNYSTAGEYAQIQVTNGTQVEIPQNWQSFRRDFADWNSASPPTFSQAADLANPFVNAFVAGRMVRIHMLGEVYHFARITQNPVAGGNSSVTINPPIPANCSGTGGWISPLNTLRYYVQNAPASEASTLVANGPMAVLRRTEVQPDTKVDPLTYTTTTGGTQTTINVDDRSVLQYVVGFSLRFMTRGPQPNSIVWVPPSLIGDQTNVASVATVTNAPETVVAVIIDLAARTPLQEPTFAFSNAVPLRTFKVFEASLGLGAARVRSAHAELLLPNIAYKGY